jgi:hypothetical protein
MNILTQNGKMKKSSQDGIDVYNFGIPAFQSNTGLKTCPMAGVCASGCYARSGTYRFGNVVNAYENRLQLTQNENFIPIMVAEISLKTIQSKSKGNTCLIRIHDSGDFYSKDYTNAWYSIMKQCPNTRFYAYTKMVAMMSQFEPLPNFRLIYSYGGLQDSQIDTTKHYHSKVFESLEALQSQGYADASNNDLVAALGESKCIGLVYHGAKGYGKTHWSKVG